jgi:hypothetical protein
MTTTDKSLFGILLLAFLVACGEVKKSRTAEALGPAEPSKAELAAKKSEELDVEALKIFDCKKAVEPMFTDEEFKLSRDQVSESAVIIFDKDSQERIHTINQPKYPQLKQLCTSLKGTNQSLILNFRRKIEYLEVVISGQQNVLTLDMNADEFAEKIRVKMEGSFNKLTLKGKSTEFCDGIAYSNTGINSSFICADVEKK